MFGLEFGCVFGVTCGFVCGGGSNSELCSGPKSDKYVWGHFLNWDLHTKPKLTSESESTRQQEPMCEAEQYDRSCLLPLRAVQFNPPVQFCLVQMSSQDVPNYLDHLQLHQHESKKMVSWTGWTGCPQHLLQN